jgi:hypothetical protein
MKVLLAAQVVDFVRTPSTIAVRWIVQQAASDPTA